MEQTDWPQIVALYDRLLALEPSPVIRLNRAIAVALRDGPAAGLILMDGLGKEDTLSGYYWFFAAKADLHRRLGDTEAADAAYRRALDLTQSEPERRFLQKRRNALREQ